MGLLRLAGHVLPGAPGEARVVRLLRPAVRHRGDQFLVLPAAVDLDGRALGRAGTPGVHLRHQARPVRFAPQEAPGARGVAGEPPRPGRPPRDVPGADAGAAAAALAPQRGPTRRVPGCRRSPTPVGRRAPRSELAARRHAADPRTPRRRAVHPRSPPRPPLGADHRLDLPAVPWARRGAVAVPRALHRSPAGHRRRSARDLGGPGHPRVRILQQRLRRVRRSRTRPGYGAPSANAGRPWGCMPPGRARSGRAAREAFMGELQVQDVSPAAHAVDSWLADRATVAV